MGITEKVGDKAKEYWMTLPQPKEYSDIHGGTKMQKITMKRITDYLQSNEKDFEDKCKLMYEQR